MSYNNQGDFEGPTSPELALGPPGALAGLRRGTKPAKLETFRRKFTVTLTESSANLTIS